LIFSALPNAAKAPRTELDFARRAKTEVDFALSTLTRESELAQTANVSKHLYHFVNISIVFTECTQLFVGMEHSDHEL